MLCIFAFVIFLIFFPILGFFPEYRSLFKKSWICVFKKVTFKPCDINLGEELKNKFLGKLIFKYPKFTKFLDKTFSFWAFLFIVVNIWSLVAVFQSGLNLWVYDTCDPVSSEGCSLSGEACGVGTNQLDFTTAYNTGKLGEYTMQPFAILGDTISRIPDRLKTWDSKDYLSPTATYLNKFDASKPTAVEFIDPGCQYCRKLFGNIKSAGFADKYNLTYVVYPIPDAKNTANNGWKFQASYTIASYMEAAKQVTPSNPKSDTPTDWQLLEVLFTEPDGKTDIQNNFNNVMSKKDIPTEIEKILTDIGYNNDEIAKIRELSTSDQVKQSLAAQKDIVENKLRTIKIPTIVFAGRRYDRVVDVETLRR
jgi:hypothetical protein